jgi:hypothetical protein
VIRVSVPCGLVDVEAEVERLAADDFVLLWCDPSAVRALGLSDQKLAALMVRCKLECLRIESLQLGTLETLRERDGIASLLDDIAPAHCSDRDSRISEVA